MTLFVTANLHCCILNRSFALQVELYNMSNNYLLSLLYMKALMDSFQIKCQCNPFCLSSECNHVCVCGVHVCMSFVCACVNVEKHHCMQPTHAASVVNYN